MHIKYVTQLHTKIHCLQVEKAVNKLSDSFETLINRIASISMKVQQSQSKNTTEMNERNEKIM